MGTLEVKLRASSEIHAAGLADSVVAVRDGSDGLSAVYIVEDGSVAAVSRALAGAGFRVTVEDSENPQFSALRVRG